MTTRDRVTSGGLLRWYAVLGGTPTAAILVAAPVPRMWLYMLLAAPRSPSAGAVA